MVKLMYLIHFILNTMTTIGVASLTYYYILLYGNNYQQGIMTLYFRSEIKMSYMFTDIILPLDGHATVDYSTLGPTGYPTEVIHLSMARSYGR